MQTTSSTVPVTVIVVERQSVGPALSHRSQSREIVPPSTLELVIQRAEIWRHLLGRSTKMNLVDQRRPPANTIGEGPILDNASFLLSYIFWKDKDNHIESRVVVALKGTIFATTV